MQNTSDFYSTNEQGDLVELPTPENKTLADLERVIALGKPQRVIDKFAELVAVTEQWDWFSKYKEYEVARAKWQEAFESYEPQLIEPEDNDSPAYYTSFEVPMPEEPARPPIRTGKEVLAIYTSRLFKEERAKKVSEIVVTVDGMPFDGDEKSQDRMVRAITVLVGDETVPWRLADNTTVLVTQTELKKALVLAGSAQASMWIPESD